ncbi:hypothetical protein RV06_GL002292 [Enterococcus haemoperoxidus]|nr:hypothetical protein RV06_GL002292 [Enterococcus haemoperoxidus]
MLIPLGCSSAFKTTFVSILRATKITRLLSKTVAIRKEYFFFFIFSFPIHQYF